MRLRDNLAKNIWLLRREREMSQDDFAALIGIHRTYLNHIEHAKRAPTIDVIERIMIALDVPVTALLAEPSKEQ
ncbi:helix-turn-helix domain-containing protein [Qipengyuania sp. NPDC077563]|uniref:helix-turn-helix domain-containing protein n=1 Tax=Qipengyuania sp. NPDC077563 TaxID=3364497 RepID=UPI00384D121A